MTTERDIRNQIAFARNEGREEGLKEGQKEGEQKKLVEIAAKMKELGLSIDVVASATGLAKDIILNL